MIESLSGGSSSNSSIIDLQSKISEMSSSGDNLDLKQAENDTESKGDSQNPFQDRQEKSDLRAEGKGLVLDISA